MRKTCLNVLKVAVSASLVCALTPSSALADVSEQVDDIEFNTESVDASTDTVPTEDLQETDTTLLAEESEVAAEAVESYFEARAEEVAGQGAQSVDAASLSAQVKKTSKLRAENLQQMADTANINITSASTTVAVEDVQADGDVFTVQAYEQTVFEYDDLSDGVGGSDVAIFGTDHSLVVEASDAEATIAADAYDESDISAIDTTDADGASSGQKSDFSTSEDLKGSQDQTALEILSSGVESVAEGAMSLVVPKKAEAATYSYDFAYDTAKAIAYSNTYALKYNTNYRNFNPDGGDCANFVSQSLNAGGFTQISGGYASTSAWYYKSSKNYAQSWVYCPTFVSYMKKHGKYVKNPKKSAVFPGSPVVYMSSSGVWAHATICVGYNSAGTPVINAHNSDRYHVPYTYWNTTRCTIQLTQLATGNVGGADNEADVTFTSTVQQDQNGNASQSSALTGEYRYTVLDEANKTVRLTGYTGTAPSVTVPKTVVNSADGVTYTVAEIANGVFAGNKSIRTATISNSAVANASNLFKGCTALSKVTYTYKTKKIGTGAFSGCTALTSVGGTKKVQIVYSYAFYGCKALTSFPSLANAITIGEYAFAKCRAITTMPQFAKVTKVGSYAFRDLDALTSVPSTSFPLLSTLGTGAFYGCNVLTSVSLTSPYLTSIPNKVFAKCRALKNATIASTKVARMGDYAFWKCTVLKKLKIYTSKLSKKRVGFRAFWKNKAKMKIYVPKAKRAKYKKAFVYHGLWGSCKFKSLKNV